MNDHNLLDGIIKQAEEDAVKIKERAQRTISEKNDALEARKLRMYSETDQKIAEKLKEIEKHTDSAVESEKRRKKLKKCEEINSAVIDNFYDRMEKLIGTEDYDEFLSKLIAEGVIAVDEDNVEVTCSHKEQLSSAILEKAAAYVKNYDGRIVKIKWNSEDKSAAQGVTIKSENGRINFSNRISSRLRRFDEDVKQIIFAELNKE